MSVTRAQERLERVAARLRRQRITLARLELACVLAVLGLALRLGVAPVGLLALALLLSIAWWRRLRSSPRPDAAARWLDRRIASLHWQSFVASAAEPFRSRLAREALARDDGRIPRAVDLYRTVLLSMLVLACVFVNPSNSSRGPTDAPIPADTTVATHDTEPPPSGSEGDKLTQEAAQEDPERANDSRARSGAASPTESSVSPPAEVSPDGATPGQANPNVVATGTASSGLDLDPSAAGEPFTSPIDQDPGDGAGSAVAELDPARTNQLAETASVQREEARAGDAQLAGTELRGVERPGVATDSSSSGIPLTMLPVGSESRELDSLELRYLRRLALARAGQAYETGDRR